MNDNHARPDNENIFDEIDDLAKHLGIDEDDAISIIHNVTEKPERNKPFSMATTVIEEATYNEDELTELSNLYQRIVSDENLEKPENPPSLEEILAWARKWVIKDVRAVVYGSFERYGFIESKRYNFSINFYNVTDEERKNAPAYYSDFDL